MHSLQLSLLLKLSFYAHVIDNLNFELLQFNVLDRVIRANELWCNWRHGELVNSLSKMADSPHTYMHTFVCVCVYLCVFIMHTCDRFRLSLASLSPALNILCQLLSIPFAFLQLFQLKRQKKLLPDAPQGKARQGRAAAQPASRPVVKQRSKQFSSTVCTSLSPSRTRRPTAFGEYNFLVPDVTMNTH